jgi:hypothetical protein
MARHLCHHGYKGSCESWVLTHQKQALCEGKVQNYWALGGLHAWPPSSPPSARTEAVSAWTDELDGMMRRDLPALHLATGELLRRAVLQRGDWDESRTKIFLGLVQNLLLVR